MTAVTVQRRGFLAGARAAYIGRHRMTERTGPVLAELADALESLRTHLKR